MLNLDFIEKATPEMWAALFQRARQIGVRTPSWRDLYRDYITSPAWKLNRFATIARADGRCQECKQPAPLEAHHKNYERIGCERGEDLTALCRGCHAKQHGHTA